MGVGGEFLFKTRQLQKAPGLLGDLAEVAQAPALADNVEEIAMFPSRGIGPLAGGTLRRFLEPHKERAARGVVDVADHPVPPRPLAVGEIVSAHRLGFAREAACSVRRHRGTSRGLPFTDARNRIAVEHVRQDLDAACVRRQRRKEQLASSPCAFVSQAVRGRDSARRPPALRTCRSRSPSAPTTARTLRLCRGVRAAMALGELLDRNARLHMTDIGLAEHQLVEGNVA